MKSRRISTLTVVLAACCGLLLISAPGRAEAAPPPNVPDLTDPTVQDRFAPISLAMLDGDPDFPAVLLANRGEGAPQFLLVILDARNGKETWSLRDDAAVFYLLLAAPTKIQQAFLDAGFADRGTASGEFVAAGPGEAEELLGRLREGYLRARRLTRLGASI